MILARWALAIGLSCAALPALDARADVLEIDADGARWVTGAGRAQPAAPDESMTLGTAEVPGDIVVPDIAVADPGRHARLVPQDYRAKVAEVAGSFDISPNFIEELVWQESRWRANAVSPVGARGLAQLMPGTASDLGVDPDDPFANLEGGARYLREQLDRFDGDLEKALAAYNAGPGRVIRAGGVPRIRETQLYVAAIMGRLSDHSRE